MQATGHRQEGNDLMGASGWDYIVPYEDSLTEALERLRHRIFIDHDYISPSDVGLPSPQCVADLSMLEIFEEFMGTHGTHSIIDIANGISNDPLQKEGTIRPLAESEAKLIFGSARPTRADYDSASRGAVNHAVTGGRWTGRSLVLWNGDKPSEIAFWGYSGD